MIKLNSVTDDHAPRTFEEWVQIHGEPEYIREKKPKTSLSIEVVDCQHEESPIDTTGIFYEDKKGNMKINYGRFVDVFASLNECVYCHGLFYTPNGAIENGYIRQEISKSLQTNGWVGKLDTETNSLYKSLQDSYYVEELTVDENVIPLANGDLHLSKEGWEFRLGEKKHSPYRLTVNYTPLDKPAPLFDKWLNDVFEPEDIPTIQDIMGYCLVPTTAAQEAFFLVGDGEVGKSGLGKFLESMLGNGFESVETQQLVTGRFNISSAENKLVVYDDDLGSAALTETGLLKKLITADTRIPAERKFAPAYSFRSYCKVLASANFMLSSLYDDSDGFYRRLHPILVKRRDPNRKLIRGFYDLIMEQEKEQILRWALVGLKRVIDNGWEITWSQRSQDYMGVTKSNGVHFQEFFDETCKVAEGADVSSAELKKLYLKWCKDNAIKDASERRMERWFADNAERLLIIKSKNIYRAGKQVRGYIGAKIKSEWVNSVPF